MSVSVVHHSPESDQPMIMDRIPVTVLLLEGIHQSAIDLFQASNMRVCTIPTALSEHDLITAVNGEAGLKCLDGSEMGPINVLGIRSKTTLTQKFFEETKKSLFAVGCFCIGTNQVNCAAANAHGVPVFNAPYANTRSVAELVIAEVICLARKLCDNSKEVHQGVWSKSAAGCMEIRGKSIGIIGYGHIGSQVGVLAEMLGMKVRFYDHVPKLPMGNNRAVAELDDLLAKCDFITLHVPETPETTRMIGKEQLAKMKKGSFLLNLSRGTVVVIEDLADALNSGHLAGAAVDVYPEEPEGNCKNFQTPLQGIKNVILTPHIGGSTFEAQKNIGTEVAYALKKFMLSGATTGSVNFPIVEPPQEIGTAHRLINIHKNVPGVLRVVNSIISDLGGNIRRQMLSTDENIGYLVIDIDQDVSLEVHEKLQVATFTIMNRVVEACNNPAFTSILSPTMNHSRIFNISPPLAKSAET